MRLRLLVALTAALFTITGTAQAATGVLLQASGMFDSNVETTSISAPGDTWSISLAFSNPVFGASINYGTPTDGTAVQYHGSGTNNYYGLDAIYKLNGADLSSNFVTEVDFFGASPAGIDFIFQDQSILSLYLIDIRSLNSISLSPPGEYSTISIGSYSLTADVNDDYASSGSDPGGAGTLTTTQIGLAPVTPPPAGTVPEPATWAFMVLGLGMVGAALRRRPPALAA
jgi:hypothetical protein